MCLRVYFLTLVTLQLSGEAPGRQEGGEVGVVTEDPASVTCKVLEDDSGVSPSLLVCACIQ